MILAFKKQFVPKIIDRTKIHTIREDKKNRWKIGMKVHMSTGVRTSNYNCFAESEVYKIDTIRFKWFVISPFGIELGKGVNVYINDKDVTNRKDIIDRLVKNDGFASRKEFFEWFNTDFSGKIIHWKNLQIKN